MMKAKVLTALGVVLIAGQAMAAEKVNSLCIENARKAAFALAQVNDVGPRTFGEVHLMGIESAKLETDGIQASEIVISVPTQFSQGPVIFRALVENVDETVCPVRQIRAVN